MGIRLKTLGAGAAGLIVAGIVALAPLGAAQARPDHGMWGGPMMGMDGQGDPAAMDRHMDAMIQHALADIDTSADQRSKIATIFKAARTDLAPVRQQLRDGHLKTMDLFAAPTIDRAALEKQRSAQAQLQDTVSKRMLQAFADAADVLTPAQRAKLAEKHRARLERMQAHMQSSGKMPPPAN